MSNKEQSHAKHNGKVRDKRHDRRTVKIKLKKKTLDKPFL